MLHKVHKNIINPLVRRFAEDTQKNRNSVQTVRPHDWPKLYTEECDWLKGVT